MRALVLAGGGSKGAYEVGALMHIINELGAQYDIITGVSVGALNGAWLAQYPKGQERAGLADLSKLWWDLSTEDVHVPWNFHPVSAIWKPSLYNSAPLQKLVRGRLSLDKVRKAARAYVGVGAVSLDSGVYRMFTPDDDNFVDGVLASSAFPAMLNPIKTDGEWWTDGGLRDITPLNAAIQAGATSCDVVLPSPAPIPPREGRLTVLGIALRSLEILLHEVQVNDLAIARKVNEVILTTATYRGHSIHSGYEVNGKRYVWLNVYQPQTGLAVDSLEFNHAQIVKMMSTGYADARRISSARKRTGDG